MSKEIKTMMGTHTETVYLSSPTLAGLERHQRRTKLDLLNVGDSCMAEANCGATGSVTRICFCCLLWLFRTHSLWTDTLLSLDIVGRALVLPQSNMPYPLWGVNGGSGRGEGRRNGRRRGSGNWDWYVK